MPQRRWGGNARDRECRLFGGKRCLGQGFSGNRRGVEKVEVRIGLRQPVGVRQRGEGILRRSLGHGNRALREQLQVKTRIGRNAGDTPSDKNTERKVVAFGGFRRFNLAEADGDGAGAPAHHHRVRRIGAGLAGEVHEFGCAFFEVGRIDRV